MHFLHSDTSVCNFVKKVDAIEYHFLITKSFEIWLEKIKFVMSGLIKARWPVADCDIWVFFVCSRSQSIDERDLIKNNIICNHLWWYVFFDSSHYIRHKINHQINVFGITLVATVLCCVLYHIISSKKRERIKKTWTIP